MEILEDKEFIWTLFVCRMRRRHIRFHACVLMFPLLTQSCVIYETNSFVLVIQLEDYES